MIMAQQATIGRLDMRSRRGVRLYRFVFTLDGAVALGSWDCFAYDKADAWRTLEAAMPDASDSVKELIDVDATRTSN